MARRESGDASGHEGLLPLAGVRVVETTCGVLEGCGRLLADLGADVVLVEPPEGAVSRRHGPFHDGRSVSFAIRNVNKRSVAINLDSRSGQSELLTLLAAADIWLDASPPGWLERRGLDFDTVSAKNGRLVVVSMTDFGRTGPYREYVASPDVHTAMSGMLGRSGIGGRPPLMPPVDLAYQATASQAAWAALVGYWHTLGTGQGDLIDFSILEATAQVIDPAMGMSGTAAAASMPKLYEREHGRPTVRPYPIYPCVDGHVRILILAARQWRGMRAWLGEPEDLQDERYDDVLYRAGAGDLLYGRISELVKGSTVAELVDEGQRRGIPIAPVLDLAAVGSVEHFRQRGAVAEVEIADGLHATVPNGTVELDGRRMGIRFRSPEIDEHRAAVLREWADFPGAGRQAEAGRWEPAIAQPPAEPGRPLAGLRVLDFGVIVYGSELGRLLADQGAQVIRVENSAFPDGARAALGVSNMTLNFAAGNRGKMSVGINLRTSEGVALVRKLAAASDLVLANFKPGTLEKLGVGADELMATQPRLVVVQSSAMGSHGPWSSWMGYGPLVRSVTGLTSLWRYDDDPDSFADAVTMYPDNYCARVMAVAALAGLIRSRRTGDGAVVDGAQAEAVLSDIAIPLAMESLVSGAGWSAAHVRAGIAPSGVYPCAGDDEWCVITIRDERDLETLRDVIGHTAGGALDGNDPDAPAGGLETWLSGWTSTLAPNEVQDRLQAAGIPAGKMLRVTEYADEPHLVAREFLKPLTQPGVGTVSVENASFFARTIRPPEIRPAPKLGEHTREILATVLRLNGEEIADLFHRGIVEEPCEVSLPR